MEEFVFSSDVGDEHVEPSSLEDGITVDPNGRFLVWRHGQCLGSFAMRAIAEAVLTKSAAPVIEEEDPTTKTLEQWWAWKMYTDLQRTAPKIAEYGSEGSGSGDIDMMAQCFKMLRPDLDDPICVDLALAFYLQGKVARIFSSLSRNKPANEDSWFDARIYTLMAQAIHERGHWG